MKKSFVFACFGAFCAVGAWSVSAAEGVKFAATMNDFVKTITAMGENKKLEDLRCKE